MSVIKTFSLNDEAYEYIREMAKRRGTKESSILNFIIQEKLKEERKDNSKLINCNNCGATYSSKLDKCPNCGKASNII
jgi:predicted Zn-ribbon and HTH transcriptional regulator